jgi:hypothetical protein
MQAGGIMAVTDTHSGTQLDKVELWSKIGAGFLALTYVSGYLTATAYLGTYDIPTDVSEFFRAKYLYIGCEYWLFITLFASLFTSLRLSLDWLKSKGPSTFSERLAVFQSPKPGYLRWVVTIVSLIVVFCVEIMFLTPGTFRPFVALQSLFLLVLCLNQATYYRAYAKESYGWGVLYGRRLINRLRWFLAGLGWAIALVIVLKIAFQTFTSWLDQWIASSVVAIITVALILCSVTFAALVVCAPSEWLKPTTQRFSVRRSNTFRSAARLGFAGFPVAFCWMTLSAFINPYQLRLVIILEYSTLILALVALANLIWLTKLGDDRDKILRATAAAFEKARSQLNETSDAALVREAKRILEMNKSSGQDMPSVQAEPWKRVTSIGVPVVVLYVVSVFGFAYLIYPHIPVQKAGGNYSTARVVTVVATDGGLSSGCSSAWLVNMLSEQKCFVPLEETVSAVYLAPRYGSAAGGGPECWKWGAVCGPNDRQDGNRPATGACAGSARETDETQAGAPLATASRPTIFAVNRSCIAAISTVE